MVDEQIMKYERRLEESYHTGDITSARSLVEGALQQIEALLDPSPPSYDGKLSSHYKCVYRKLNLDPSQEELNDTAPEVLSGPAELAVDAAKTLVSFLDRRLTYQQERGPVDLPEVLDS